MTAAFEKLPEDKKQNILDICIEEFANNGYENTSTDTITSRAGISKGILFHYFKSKKNLFLYVLNHCVDVISNETIAEIANVTSEDFFERIKELVIAKQKVALRRHKESEFVLRFYAQPPTAVKKEFEELHRKRIEVYEDPSMLRLIYRTDLLEEQKLRTNMNADKVLKMTMFIVEKISESNLALVRSGMTDVEALLGHSIKEIDEYLDVIKNGIYSK